MANWKKVDADQLDADLTSVADAIRSKTGGTDELSFPSDFDSAIRSIQTGSTGITPTGEIDITENGTYDVTSYASANVALPEAAQATPQISVSSSGLITASATQEAGVVPAGTKSSTQQLATQEAKNITPGTIDQTAVSSGKYTTGDVTVDGDSNLVAENIKSGVSIFGVAGTYAGSSSSEPIMQTKSVTPSETVQIVTPDSGYDALSSVSVGAISSTYIGSGVTKKSAQTYTPGTNDQTIEANQYLTGTQTIKGDSKLIAENIKSGVSIFGVLGSFVGESGGGLPSDISALASGTVTPSEDVKTALEITHNLGVVPDFLVWWDTTDFSSAVESGTAYFGASLEKRVKASSTSTTVNNNHFSVHGYNTSGASGQTGSRAANTTRMTVTTAALITTTAYPIKAGHTYRWVCGAVA